MITEYKEASFQAYPDLARTNRIKRIEKALGHLVSAANILAGAAEDEYAEITSSGEIAKDDQRHFDRIGERLVRLSEIGAVAHESIHAAPVKITETIETPQPTPVSTVRQPLLRDRGSEDTPSSGRKKQAPKREYAPYRKGELYSRIMSVEDIPLVELEEGTDPIDLRITSDNTITMNGQEVTLTGNRLFVFNAFMALRDKDAITASDIRERGFHRGTSQAGRSMLSTAIKQTRELLRTAAGTDYDELITKHGKKSNAFYTVNPAIISSDVVREGSVVTISFPSETEDDSQTIRIASRSKPRNPDDTVKTLSSQSPLAKLLPGVKLGETLQYKDTEGNPVQLRVDAIK